MDAPHRSSLTEIFTAQRTHLRAVAYRMLGSVQDADDAVQETWLRLQRSDAVDIQNLPAWLTTVVSRICLDQLRSRTARREDLDADPIEVDDALIRTGVVDPEAEAVQADQVGKALMIVLDTLAPAERLAFCLHDLFGLSFDEVGAVLGRSAAASRQLASRARRRVRGQNEAVEVDRAKQKEVVEAFLAAARHGEFDALMALLHPEALVTSDAAAAAMGSPALVRGREQVAEFFNKPGNAARRAVLDGFAAGQWTYRGELKVVFAFTVEDGLVRQIELLAGDLDRLDLV